MDKETKAGVIKEFARSDNDVGSADVQIAVLTTRIRELTDHLRANRKDHSSRRGLIALVNRRRRLLRYVRGKDVSRYSDLIKRLGIRR
jgi:small subunit ribosomal protein S15